MRTIRTLGLTLLAAVLMASYAASASAATITVSPGNNITSTANGSLTFTDTSGNNAAICSFTLRGTIVTSTVAAENTSVQVGNITGGTAGSCTGLASALTFLGFPWPIQILIRLNVPSTGQVTVHIIIRNDQFLLQTGLAGSCLYNAGTTGLTGTASGASPSITVSVATVAAQSVAKSSGGFFCPSPGQVQGTLTLTTQTIRIIL